MYINTLNDYLKKTYGYKLYKISLDGGMTCPNRDGRVSRGGCIFCSEGGSGDFAQGRLGNVTEQIEQGKKQVERKYRGGRYIAYFQSYTNTYEKVEYLRKIFMEAISHPDVEILSIATRPDCIDEEIGELLGELNRIKPVWIELGLQTSCEKTAKLINRGYDNEIFTQAVRIIRKYDNCLNSKGSYMEVITHMIIGLPGENISDMIETVRFINQSDIQGIKLQLLHVLKGTELERIYREGGVKIYSMEEYIDILFRLIEELKDSTVIHRMTGDGPKKLLIEPAWTGNKRMVMNTVNRELRERNIVQGSRCINSK